MNKAVRHIVKVIFVVLLQVLMCNRIALWGVATPFFVVYLFSKIPTGTKTQLSIITAFFIGLIIDVFTGTLGVYALASVTAAFLQGPLLSLISYRDREKESFVPSFESLGRQRYILYLVLLTFVFCLVLFCAESFTFFSFWLTAVRIVSSTLLTVVVLLIVDLLIEKKS
ncbi:MAG: rod shape-determining protein MreD [Porphyromonadaceae bacterium]|nr:rod shape-determining protein MreD [Porphyromonadaceae bacterium]